MQQRGAMVVTRDSLGRFAGLLPGFFAGQAVPAIIFLGGLAWAQEVEPSPTSDATPEAIPGERLSAARELRAFGTQAIFDGRSLRVRAEPADGRAPDLATDPDATFELVAVEVGGARANLRRRTHEAESSSDHVRLPLGEGVSERYDARPLGIEQSFIIEKPLGAGEVVLRVAVDTGLRGVEDDAGVAFVDAAGIGRLRYSRALAIDAAGSTSELDTRWHPLRRGQRGEIRIRVPAELAANAAYPLVVDPLIGNAIGIDGSYGTGNTAFWPSAAVDPNSAARRALVAYVKGSSPYTVYARTVDEGGAVGTAYSLGSSTGLTARPSVAFSTTSQRYAVVYRLNGNIYVSVRTSTGAQVSAQTLVATGDSSPRRRAPSKARRCRSRRASTGSPAGRPTRLATSRSRVLSRASPTSLARACGR
jgi:hypothetical protein